jgi:outer membrane protein assembly factor BamB
VIFGSDDNYVYALNGEDGSYLWSYSTGNSISSSPCLGDLDNNGTLEVVVGSDDNNVYALNGVDGTYLWSYTTGNRISSSPCLGDIDNDGTLEVVFGSEDNNVYALNGEDWSYLWSYSVGNSISSSPGLGDVDEDGFLEVVIGSNDYNVYTLNGDPTGIKEIAKNIFADGKFILSQNYPNPVVTKTTIKYSLPKKCNVKLQLYDVVGRQVAILVNEHQKPGDYVVNWDTQNISDSKLPGGIYFYRLRAGDYVKTKKMIVCR